MDAGFNRRWVPDLAPFPYDGWAWVRSAPPRTSPPPCACHSRPRTTLGLAHRPRAAAPPQVSCGSPRGLFRPYRYERIASVHSRAQGVSSDEGGWGPAPHTLTSQNTKVRPEAMSSQARQIRHQCACVPVTQQYTSLPQASLGNRPRFGPSSLKHATADFYEGHPRN